MLGPGLSKVIYSQMFSVIILLPSFKCSKLTDCLHASTEFELEIVSVEQKKKLTFWLTGNETLVSLNFPQFIASD